MTSLQLKQPNGLYNLSFIEFWERFGFYCVQSLLILFLIKSYHMPDAQAYDLFGAYSALTYATLVIGGYIADRFIGFRHAILLGTFLYLFGYFALATTSKILFYPALALLICGNGFFKSSVSSLLGTLYEKNDARRDSGFTIFYMCFNIGSFLGPLLAGEIAQRFDFLLGLIRTNVFFINFICRSRDR